MTITEFLLARIAEVEAAALAAVDGQIDPENGWGYEGRALTPNVGIIHHPVQADHITRWHPYRVLAECKAKRAIIALHEQWPVLVEEPPSLERVGNDPESITIRMTQRMAWLTEREYRERFGVEPPTATIVAALAAVDADHPDYNPAWA